MSLARPVLARLLGVVLALPLATGAASAAPRFTMTPLGTQSSVPYAINNSGVTVGTYSPFGYEPHAWINYQPGLGTLPGGSTSTAYDINDSGTVVGYSDRALYEYGTMTNEAFRYDRQAGMTALGTLGPQLTSVAYGINNAGVIVGAGMTDLNTLYSGRALTFGAGGPQLIAGQPADRLSSAEDINDRGQIIGRYQASVPGAATFQMHGFLLSNGTMQEIGTFGGPDSTPTALNDRGWVVGRATTADSTGWFNVEHAFLYRDGVMTDLGTLGGFGAMALSSANDINEQGQVVGNFSGASGVHGFLYDNGQIYDLNSLTDLPAGWRIYDAVGINEGQQIAALGCWQNECMAVRLDPIAAVPEPSTCLMLLGGLGLLGWRVHRPRSKTA
ncbi:MAG: DUF3466 family protein [Gammaproteobacteria bacterium]